mmetsp:Transcript_17839/g.24741  ORF Transcript_17839/g.24741 Transcript_17839/m.24741 type:complete len:244 (-) Transcript_17839:213-944(-)|eukprot:jgi/Bigna1/141855/aug1.65_g16563
MENQSDTATKGDAVVHRRATTGTNLAEGKETTDKDQDALEALLIETRLEKLIGLFKKKNINLEKDLLSSWKSFEETCQKLALKNGHKLRLKRGVHARMQAMKSTEETESDEEAVYQGCSCDGECKMRPIRGIIWLCNDLKKDLGFCKKCWPKELEKGNVEEKDFTMIRSEVEMKKHIFTQIDKDGDGTLSKEEFVTCFTELFRAPEHFIKRQFDRVDRNNDQVLDFEEFVVFWDHMIHSQSPS